MKPTDLQTLQTPLKTEVITPGFGSMASFELMQRQAKLLASGDMVPAMYRSHIVKTDRYGNVTETIENPKAIANCTLALNMALRMNADPIMVMQNLYLVEGRPSWSSQWIIAAINNCGRFSPLRFEITDLGEQDVECVSFVWETNESNGKRFRTEKRQTVRVRNLKCIAWVLEKATGERLESPPVSIELAVKEGWYTKNGSKWQTMPEMMLRYRSASMFGRLYAPELLMGLQTQEEVRDYIDVVQGDDGTYAMPAATVTPEDLAASQPAHPEAEAVAEPAPEPEPEKQAAAEPPEAPPADDMFAQAEPPQDKPARQRRQREVE